MCIRDRYYGEEVFYEAAIDHLYRPMVMEAVEKSGLQVISIGEFKIDEIGKDKGIRCKLNVVTKPCLLYTSLQPIPALGRERLWNKIRGALPKGASLRALFWSGWKNWLSPWC